VAERFELCYCTGVTRELVLAAMRSKGCRTLDELRRASGACFGCQSCRPELEQLIRDWWAREAAGTERIEKQSE
jgi:NAD(P)H-nitrite reductase large subunit